MAPIGGDEVEMENRSTGGDPCSPETEPDDRPDLPLLGRECPRPQAVPRHLLRPSPGPTPRHWTGPGHGGGARHDWGPGEVTVNSDIENIL